MTKSKATHEDEERKELAPVPKLGTLSRWLQSVQD